MTVHQLQAKSEPALGGSVSVHRFEKQEPSVPKLMIQESEPAIMVSVRTIDSVILNYSLLFNNKFIIFHILKYFN